MIATILDTKTGLRAKRAGISSWEWAENNFSCDCNRDLWGVETDEEDGICSGGKRFIVIDAVMESEEDYEYTLRELNSEYPDELLSRFGI